MNEENIKLVREYSLDADILRNGCTAYQKKYVYPKSYIFMAIFLVLAADFVYGAVKDTNNFLAYILIVVCLALAVREWYNPRKLRRSIVEGFLEMESKPVYRLTVTEKNISISTVSEVVPDNAEDDMQEAPEASVYPIDGSLTVMEKDKFFLLIYSKLVYYIVPKEGFSDTELEIIRDLNKNINQGG